MKRLPFQAGRCLLIGCLAGLLWTLWLHATAGVFQAGFRAPLLLTWLHLISFAAIFPLFLLCKALFSRQLGQESTVKSVPPEPVARKDAKEWVEECGDDGAGGAGAALAPPPLAHRALHPPLLPRSLPRPQGPPPPLTHRGSLPLPALSQGTVT